MNWTRLRQKKLADSTAKHGKIVRSGPVPSHTRLPSPATPIRNSSEEHAFDPRVRFGSAGATARRPQIVIHAAPTGAADETRVNLPVRGVFSGMTSVFGSQAASSRQERTAKQGELRCYSPGHPFWSGQIIGTVRSRIKVGSQVLRNTQPIHQKRLTPIYSFSRSPWRANLLAGIAQKSPVRDQIALRPTATGPGGHPGPRGCLSIPGPPTGRRYGAIRPDRSVWWCSRRSRRRGISGGPRPWRARSGR